MTYPSALLGSTVAGLTAAVLTFFELDRTFRIPASVTKKPVLYGLWWSFVAINGALAYLLYGQVADLALVASWPVWLKGVVIGGAYLSLVRQKFFTTQRGTGPEKTPVGLELLYENLKEAIFRRINDIARTARANEALELANKTSLVDLGRNAKLRVNNDPLLTKEQKAERLQWILTVIQDAQSTELEKKDALATFILYGKD